MKQRFKRTIALFITMLLITSIAGCSVLVTSSKTTGDETDTSQVDNTEVDDSETLDSKWHPEGTILCSETADYIDTYQTVYGKVNSATYRPDVNGGPTFINMSDPEDYNAEVTVIIWNKNRGGFNNAPEDEYDGQYIAVTGQLYDYKGATQIEAISSDNIKIYSQDEIGKVESSNQSTTSSENDLNGPYQVIKVVDGDTIQVSINGTKEKVRFIGVDTPESVSSNKSKNCEEGVIASDYTKSRLNNQEVYLEYDVGERDRYGRVLAYVYIRDEMINETLLKKGYARIMTIQPNVKYARRFSELQTKARNEEQGFWTSNPWE